MKNITRLMMVFVVVLSAFAISTANAVTQERPFIKNGQLFIRRVTTSKVADVAKVPKGLSASDALRLYRGEISNVKIETGKSPVYSFGFPIKSITKESVVSYKEGNLAVKDSLPKHESTWLITIFMVVVPIFLIALVTFINRVKRVGTKKLLLFYGGVFFMMLIGGALPGLANQFISAFVGGAVGAYTGILAITDTFDREMDELIIAIIAVAGAVTTSMLSGVGLLLHGGMEIIYDYAIFLAVVMGVSYFAVAIFFKIKKKIQIRSECQPLDSE